MGVIACAIWQGVEKWETGVAEVKDNLLCLEVGRGVGSAPSDCLLVIQALRSGVKGNGSFTLVIEDIIQFRSCFDEVIWSFVKRSGNKVSHTLAHFQPCGLMIFRIVFWLRLPTIY